MNFITTHAKPNYPSYEWAIAEHENVPLGHDRWNVEWINGLELLFCRPSAISLCNASLLECQKKSMSNSVLWFAKNSKAWIFECEYESFSTNSSKIKWTKLWTSMKTFSMNSNIFHQTIHITLTTLISYWTAKMIWRRKKMKWYLNEVNISLRTSLSLLSHIQEEPIVPKLTNDCFKISIASPKQDGD